MRNLRNIIVIAGLMLASVTANAQVGWNNFNADMGMTLLANDVDGAGMLFTMDFKDKQKNITLGGEFGFLGYTGPLSEGWHASGGCSSYSCWSSVTYSDGKGYGDGGYLGGVRIGIPVGKKKEWLLIGSGGAYWWKSWNGRSTDGSETIPYARIYMKNIKGHLSYEFGIGTLEFINSNFGASIGIGYNF